MEKLSRRKKHLKAFISRYIFPEIYEYFLLETSRKANSNFSTSKYRFTNGENFNLKRAKIKA